MASVVAKGKGKASEVEKGKDKDKANWDAKAHDIWVDVFVAEVRAGNRTGTTFSRQGWKNLVANFNAATGRDYDRKQLKNRLDTVRKDWVLWEFLLGKETGLGWDSERQTVAADDEWWEKKIQMNPEVAKFRIKGLDHCHKLDEIYRPVTATGARAWAPTSGELPPMYENCPTENDGLLAFPMILELYVATPFHQKCDMRVQDSGSDLTVSRLM
ncbi:hypothetical protein L1049_010260 [Liquidambar formosana]|uniref:Myb/SANT-like domain-containing protein n=1 Tax=Liquidambar formosana TaxID=63359 RepID=A0AAP0R488_LIQFO